MKPTDKTLRKLGISFVAEEAGISEYLLNSNALKILLAPDPTARTVVVVQHVRVGSRHEGAGNTGYSHLLEHMLFKGTPTHNKAKGNSYDQFVKALGNISNATTDYDRTNYFAKIPSYALAEYLEHEADRLRNAIITDEDLSTEMPVVVDEFDIGENDPDQVLDKLLMAQAYTEHPYKVDVIGAKSEVLNVTADSLKERLYNVYYWPNNVTLIIVGGFDVEQALRYVARSYGKIPASPRPIPTPYTVEPAQFGERRFVIRKPGDLPRIGMTFHATEADHEDYYALSALALILGGTASSRLHRKLVDKGLCSDAGVSLAEMHDPAVLKVGATVNPGVEPKLVERIILREIERFQKTLVPARELSLTKRLNRNGTLMARADRLNFAMHLSSSEAAADWRWATRYDTLFDKVTPADLQTVAQRYLTENNRTVGYFLPSGEPVKQAQPEAEEEQAETKGSRLAPAATEAPAAASAPVIGTAGGGKRAAVPTYASQVKKVVLPNGLTLLLMPTQTESAIGFSLMVNAGVSRAPQEKRAVARMTAQLLTRGSSRYSKKRINELASEMLVRYGWNVEPFRSSLSTLVPPADLPRFLDMLADSLQHPTFNAEELELVRKQSGAGLNMLEQDPNHRAMTALVQSLYEPASPFYMYDFPTRRAQLASVTTDDLRAFHKDAYTAAGAVLTLVGKFDASEMQQLVETKLGKWASGEPAKQVTATQAKPVTAAQRVNINLEGKDNLTILVGVSSPYSMRADDYVAALIANQALGGDTLGSRLGYEIREKRGMTYGVTSFFTQPLCAGGPWIIEMTTNGKKLERAIPLISEVVNTYVKDGISEQELALEKGAAILAQALQLDGPIEIAVAVSNVEYAGVGVQALDAFEAKVKSLTREQVNETIRTHFRLDKATTAVAGSLPDGTTAS